MEFDANIYQRQMSRALDLEIRPDWAAAVTGNLRMLEAAAALLSSFDLADDVESALIFQVP